MEAKALLSLDHWLKDLVPGSLAYLAPEALVARCLACGHYLASEAQPGACPACKSPHVMRWPTTPPLPSQSS